jgi:GNAT superfamily N-acetyltransferase
VPASPDPRIERVGFGHPDAMHLIAEVQLEYVRRYGSVDETPLDPLMFELPHGSFFVGYVRDVPVMTGAWRRRGDVDALGTTNAAEIKRMYVVSGLRGHGLARLMLAHLEETAAEAGAEAMVLETGTESPEAIGLYASSGYVRIEPFGFYAHEPITRCFAKRL